MPKKKPESAALVGPQTEAEWVRATVDRPDATPEARVEYCRLLDLYLDVAWGNGDLALIYRCGALKRFECQPAIEEAVKHYQIAMRQRLGGDEATPLESLLIDAIGLCWHDYSTFAMMYSQKTSDRFTLGEMEQWERVLASKEARYQRSIETLARVRRLLKLPALQVNFAAAGGQQVNVAGELGAGRLAPKDPGGLGLTNWNMCSITGNQHHPISGSLALGETKTFPNTGGPIWNNIASDPGALYNQSGQLVSYWFD